MSLSIQYYNGTDYTQFGLDVADYTISAGLLATQFYSIKDSNDTLWIWGLNYANDNNKTVLIAISSTGVKRRAILNGNSFTCKDKGQLIILRNGDLALQCYVSGTSTGLYGVSKDFVGAGEEIVPYAIKPIGSNAMFAIYQDRYIWVASGTTVKIYDYTTKAELATTSINTWFTDSASSSGDRIDCFCLGLNGESAYFVMNLYDDISGQNRTVIGGLNKVDGGNWSKLFETILSTEILPKQVVLDKYGDLIILTNTGTASTLLKYTTAGVQVGTTLDLGGAFYNLNTDKDGNYYYSNALGTYKITTNTAQGQAFTGVGTKIRGSGMITYGNNITNYNPAVFGGQ